MKDLTKIALGESLRKLMAEKPLNKITISDITKDCGCNRMTFYYHFHDIYELLEWALEQETEEALDGKLTLASWQDGLRNVFARLKENQAIVMNIRRNANRDVLELYLHRLAAEPLEGFVQEIAGKYRTEVRGVAAAAGQSPDGQAAATGQIDETAAVIDDEDALFIASFIEYGVLGLLRDWIDRGMKGDPEEIIARFGMLINAFTG
jgi:AcrR family transcriptional regulator